MAMGALLAVRELGLRCPDDVSIAGFDNLDVAELLMPPLTTVQQPAYKLGAAAAELLLERIAGLSDPPHEVVLTTELVRRSSVLRIGSRSQVAKPGKSRKAVSQALQSHYV
jgi:LacI family transcriptional regulator